MLKRVAVTFVIALAVYVVGYRGIEHGRTRQGPWKVVFTNTVSGAPAIRIDQPNVNITNVLIAFPGQAIPTAGGGGSIDFGQPRPVPWEVPFGQCVFMDTTWLPGTLVFQLFGHEIQLLPRVLTIDKSERPWRSDETLVLRPAKTDAGFQPAGASH